MSLQPKRLEGSTREKQRDGWSLSAVGLRLARRWDRKRKATWSCARSDFCRDKPPPGLMATSLCFQENWELIQKGEK